MKRHCFRIAAAGLPAFVALLLFAGCFDTGDKSPRKLRVFFTSDVVGSLEPCG